MLMIQNRRHKNIEFIIFLAIVLNDWTTQTLHLCTCRLFKSPSTHYIAFLVTQFIHSNIYNVFFGFI